VVSTVTVTSSWTSAQWSLLEFIAGGGHVAVLKRGRRRTVQSDHAAATITNIDQLADWNLITVAQGAAQVTNDGRRVLSEDAEGQA
jgi:hypothetical protein